MAKLAVGERATTLAVALQHLGFVELQKLVRLFAAFGTSSGNARPQKTLDCSSLNRSWQYTSIAAQVIATWPEGFHGFVAGLRARRSSLHDRRIADSFGPGYIALFRDLSDDAFACVRAEMDGHLVQAWRGQLSRRNRRVNRDTIRAKDWVTWAEAIELSGLAPRDLSERLRVAGAALDRHQVASGRTFVAVRRADVNLAAMLAHVGKDWARLANLLGFGKRRLSRVAALGLFGGAQLSLWGEPAVPPEKWISGLRDVVLAAATRVAMPEEVELRALLRSNRLDDGEVISVLAALIERRLIPRGRAEGSETVAGLHFDKKEFGALIGERGRRPDSGLTVPELATELGVKQEVAYRWVRAGLIESSLYTVGGKRLAGSVGQASLAKFRATYATCKELAAVARSTPRTIGKRLLKLGILPASGPEIDGGRQLLFKRGAALSKAMASLREQLIGTKTVG